MKEEALFAMNFERGGMPLPWHQVAKHAGWRTIAGKVMQGVRGGGGVHIVGFAFVVDYYFLTLLALSEMPVVIMITVFYNNDNNGND